MEIVIFCDQSPTQVHGTYKPESSLPRSSRTYQDDRCIWEKVSNIWPRSSRTVQIRQWSLKLCYDRHLETSNVQVRLRMSERPPQTARLDLRAVLIEWNVFRYHVLVSWTAWILVQRGSGAEPIHVDERGTASRTC